MEEKEELNCPKCAKKMVVDSVRTHVDGRKRVYWECKNCDLNVMYRDSKGGKSD